MEVEIIEEDKPKTLNDIRESLGLPRIEDKKIEKIDYVITNEDGEFEINGFTFDYEQKLQIIDKINEIIDYLEDNK